MFLAETVRIRHEGTYWGQEYSLEGEPIAEFNDGSMASLERYAASAVQAKGGTAPAD
jgi:hypothetical protein